MLDRLKAFLKGVSYEDYLRAEIERLKIEADSLVEYEPNLLTFARDACAFGRLDLSLIYYTPIGLFGAVIYGLNYTGTFSAEDLKWPIVCLLVAPVLGAVVGTYMHWKYPVTKEYFLSFGKKR